MHPMISFISLSALEAVVDPKSPHWHRKSLLDAALVNPEFKFANITGTYQGVDAQGHPLLEMPNRGSGYIGGIKSGKHKEDTWEDWIDLFDFSVLEEGQCYFFLSVTDPNRVTHRGRPIRYPILIVAQKGNQPAGRWSAKQNEMCSTFPPKDLLEEVRFMNDNWLARLRGD